MTRKLIVSLIITLLALSCGENKKPVVPLRVDGKGLKKIVEEALWGSKTSNFDLSGLVKPDTPSPDEANRVFIDSTGYKANNELYSVLVEYPDPTFNILAVYDKDLVLYLQDNSLNGNIVTSWQTFENNSYLVASEDFLSKDFLKLTRISFYTFIGSKFDLVFRTFTKFDKAGDVCEQTLEKINTDRITTHITASKKSKLNNVVDTFYFNSTSKKYESSKNTFNDFITNEISKADWKLEKLELTKKVVAEIKTGTDNISKEETKSETSTKTGNVISNPKGFQIWLNSDWEAPVGISVSEYLISQLDGYKYENKKLGAQVIVIPLPEGSSSAQFVKYKFGKATKGDYKVRQTEKIEIGDKQIQFFEHSCEQKSYLLLLVAPLKTFDSYKNLYNGIINSFFIEC